MKVLFAGGGTAGHINPAIAIAKELGCEVLFVGTERGMENKLVPREGFEIKHIDIIGLNRKKIWKNISVVSKLFRAVRQAGEIIDEFRPDVVVGTGGYVSGPVVYAAAKRGIKTLIHEVNACAGLTSKWLSKRADVVTISFEAARADFPKAKRVELVGNPIRSEIFQFTREEARGRLGLDNRVVIAAFGGSLGAAKLNSAMAEFVRKTAGKYQVIWACGERFFNEEMKELGAVPYIHNMDEVLAAADVVVTRGGGALFEITALGRASVIVPSPNVTNNHQEHNARALEEEGAAKVILEEDIADLPRVLEGVCQDSAARLAMENAAFKMGKRDATEKIVMLVKGLS